LLDAMRTALALSASRKARARSSPHAAKSAATCIVVVPNSGFAIAALPLKRGSARSRIERGIASGRTSLRLTSSTRARAATPVQAPSLARNESGSSCACGEAYGSTRPRLTSRNGLTGSPDQKTSACGLADSATSRFRTPVLLVSSVSNTALTRMPDSRSKARKTGSEKTWSTEV
jgi:hypothetical protein